MTKQKYILTKWINNEETNDSEKNQDQYTYESDKEHSVQLKTINFDEDNLLNKIKFRKNDSSKVIQIAQNWFFRIVALILISLGIFMFYQDNNCIIKFTKKGDKSVFMLPDKSEITLNSDSEIKYKDKNWKKNRIVYLNGEAYFKVTKGEKFEVNTTLGKVLVLGTQFNVKARNNRFDVICFKGKVKVNHNDKTITLKQGDKISFENDELIIQKKTSETKPSWIENELSFEQEQLQNIVEEIERQYNISIKHNLETRNQLFSGKIPNNNLKIALQIIATTFQLQTEKISDFQYELKKMDEI
ncbi:DUF4974 domain-containing protein [Flavobacterium jejuense]|uniref:DUF4974 domain-containing protein n=1 Tax=Flavobacterium jejuense TaxID=1544455 RepID=A0ABX0IWW0_9FLAO|nr:FecR family protein [Flavobacterium jejuense]NHN26289.1 DUF4974 domain-containing protein [Flavobacterium jejuense]